MLSFVSRENRIVLFPRVSNKQYQSVWHLRGFLKLYLDCTLGLKHARQHLYRGTVSAPCLLIFSFPIDPSWFAQPNLDCHSLIQSALELSILLPLPPKVQVCTTRLSSVYNLSVERPHRAKWKSGWGPQLLCHGPSHPGWCSLRLVCLRTNGVLACRKLSDEGIFDRGGEGTHPAPHLSCIWHSVFHFRKKLSSYYGLE